MKMNKFEKNFDDYGWLSLSSPDRENKRGGSPVFRDNCAVVFFIKKEANIPSASGIAWVNSDGSARRNSAVSSAKNPSFLTYNH